MTVGTDQDSHPGAVASGHPQGRSAEEGSTRPGSVYFSGQKEKISSFVSATQGHVFFFFINLLRRGLPFG